MPCFGFLFPFILNTTINYLASMKREEGGIHLWKKQESKIRMIERSKRQIEVNRYSGVFNHWYVT